jgi:hypothetical protein
MPPDLFPFPIYGDLFTMEQFRQDCADGYFIDYDGSGCLATATGMSREVIYPSMFKQGVVFPEWATHVVWFNK